MKQNRIAVLIPEVFWSSVPYEGLNLYMHLSQSYVTDLLMFKDDIRINKIEWRGNEKFYFDHKQFKNGKRLRQLVDWGEFFSTTKNYDLIISTAHISPKHRRPEEMFPGIDFKSEMRCPFMLTDIGGTDIFANAYRAHYLCVKGPIWRKWLGKAGFPEKRIYLTGCPHYDYYYAAHLLPLGKSQPIYRKKFYQKYNLDPDKKWLLIAPSNPASHIDQFRANLSQIQELYKLATERDYQVLIKTYPHDYLFYEHDVPYSGVYKRIYDRRKPQYELLAEHLPGATILESQDHHAALIYCDKLFNMSGSHIAWETYFTNCTAYSMHYKDKPYYGGASYLPAGTVLPDEEVNVHIESLEQMFDPNLKAAKRCEQYFLKEFSLENIRLAVAKVLK